MRSALLARLQAYQAHGLAGIEPYARSGGKSRSPADELRSATNATKAAAHDGCRPPRRLLLKYPRIEAAGHPGGVSLVAVLSPRRADARARAQPLRARRRRVRRRAAAVLRERRLQLRAGRRAQLPMKTRTLVVYTNRTSTDQVTGFGGGAKRSIGSKLLASQLEELYGKVQAER